MMTDPIIFWLSETASCAANKLLHLAYSTNRNNLAGIIFFPTSRVAMLMHSANLIIGMKKFAATYPTSLTLSFLFIPIVWCKFLDSFNPYLCRLFGSRVISVISQRSALQYPTLGATGANGTIYRHGGSSFLCWLNEHMRNPQPPREKDFRYHNQWNFLIKTFKLLSVHNHELKFVLAH